MEFLLREYNSVCNLRYHREIPSLTFVHVCMSIIIKVQCSPLAKIIPWSHEITWNISWNVMKFHEMSWKFHEITSTRVSWNFMKFGFARASLTHPPTHPHSFTHPTPHVCFVCFIFFYLIHCAVKLTPIHTLLNLIILKKKLRFEGFWTHV
jgi:hypothetical protein